MAEPAVYLNFTYTCGTCGETVEVTNGVDLHPCADRPAVAIEGCNANTPLVDRVEQALADDDRLTGLTHRAARVIRMCEAYKDQPPPLFRGPGLSEHGKGYNAGTRDMARAVLAILNPEAEGCDPRKGEV